VLQESERVLRESQVVASLGSYVMDVRTGSWRASEALHTVFGIGPGYDYSVDGWAALLHPDDRAPMLAYFTHDVLALGQAFDREYRVIRHNDQAERWVHGLGRLTFDGDGRPVQMLGTIQDITVRKQAELDRKQQAADLRTRNDELSLFNRLAVGRELRMIELKQEVNTLCERLGEPSRHSLEFLQGVGESAEAAGTGRPGTGAA